MTVCYRHDPYAPYPLLSAAEVARRIVPVARFIFADIRSRPSPPYWDPFVVDHPDPRDVFPRFEILFRRYRWLFRVPGGPVDLNRRRREQGLPDVPRVFLRLLQRARERHLIRPPTFEDVANCEPSDPSRLYFLGLERFFSNEAIIGFMLARNEALGRTEF